MYLYIDVFLYAFCHSKEMEIHTYVTSYKICLEWPNALQRHSELCSTLFYLWHLWNLTSDMCANCELVVFLNGDGCNLECNCAGSSCWIFSWILFGFLANILLDFLDVIWSATGPCLIWHGGGNFPNKTFPTGRETSPNYGPFNNYPPTQRLLNKTKKMFGLMKPQKQDNDISSWGKVRKLRDCCPKTKPIPKRELFIDWIIYKCSV